MSSASVDGPSATAEVAGGDRVVLRTQALAKAFGATQALASCSFELAFGEVHAIIGENGSGKSTLVKILSGLHRAHMGCVELDGREVSFRSPRAAMAAGIIAVFQEVLVSGPRSVLENVWLGPGGMLRASIPRDVRASLARETLASLMGEAPDLSTPIEQLSLSDRQACCIARALIRSPRLLILDEATSALDVATRDRLFELLRRRADSGETSVVFISHRMDEIEEIGDRITVMRSGRTVRTVGRGEATSAEFVSLMTGTEHSSVVAGRRLARQAHGPVVLRAKDLHIAPHSRPIDFELRAGELVGLAGLEGQGQDRFLHALRGGFAAGEVVRETDAGSFIIRSPLQAAKQGVAYVPHERRGEALFLAKSVRENFALPTITRDARVGFVNDRRTERRIAAYVERLGIKLAGTRPPIGTLSGGNQQKVVIARWLASTPRIPPFIDL